MPRRRTPAQTPSTGHPPQFRFEGTRPRDHDKANRYYERDAHLSTFDAIAIAHAGDEELLSFDAGQLRSHADPAGP